MSARKPSLDVLVSIVTPVYNVSEFLPAFIESVIGQTYPNWELLLVDDGSTDNSGTICDGYAKGDNRIRVFHKANGGVCSARNVGLREMKGEWVLMPDSDDKLPLDSLETLTLNISDEIDLLSSSYILYKNGELMVPMRQSVSMELGRDEFISLMGIFPQPRNLDRRCCNKLFRASIIKENCVFFPEDLHFREDILYNYLYLKNNIRKIRCLTYDMYVYYRRKTGTAISLQERYTPESGGLFTAMTLCYDVLEQMGASKETMSRMKKEVLSTYRSVTKLIDKSGVGKEDKRLYTKTLLRYYDKWELLLVACKAFLRHLKKKTKL